MISKEDKRQKVAKFEQRLQGAEAVIVAKNAGLSAHDLEGLRDELRASDGSAQVVKNTLAKIVLRSANGGCFEALSDHLNGPLIYGVGKDPVQVAKIFNDLAEKNPNFIIFGGALPNQGMMDAESVKKLAKLPSRDQLLAQLMMTMQAPVTKLAATLHAIPSSLARALVAVRDGKQNAGE